MKKQAIEKKDLNLLLQYGLQGIDLKDAVRFSFAQGEYLFQKDEPVDYIYFVVSGKAKVFQNLSNGKRLLLCYFVSKGIIGDIELMTGERTDSNTIQAVTEFICIGLPLTVYETALKSNVAFLNCVGRELAEKLMQRGANGAVTVLQPLETRLCAYIIQTESHGMFRETLTEVANLLGASYRHLLRCLNKLCKDEVLHKQSSGYRIINRQALNKKAGDLFVLK